MLCGIAFFLYFALSLPCRYIRCNSRKIPVFFSINSMRAIFILLLLPIQLLAQDVSGIWSGTIQTQGIDLEYELVISQRSDDLSGYSLTVFAIDGVDNMGIKSVIFKKKKGSIILEDDDLIYNNYTTSPKRVKLFGTLSLTELDTAAFLDGTFYTRQIDLRSPDDNLYSGTIHLRRLDNMAKTKLTSQLDKMNLLSSLSFSNLKTKPEVIASNNEVPQPSVVKTEEPVKPSAIKDTAIALLPNKIKVDTIDQKPAQQQVLVKEKQPEPEKTSDFGDLITPKTTAKNQTPTEVVKKPDISLNKAVDKKPLETAGIPRVADLPAVSNAAARIAERKTEIIRNVFFRSDSLTFSLYDNGTVDGDTVSVVMNGQVIIPRQGLTGQGFRVIVPTPVNLGDSILVTMYAENLGAIAPNTGLLIIQDGNERSEIRFEGDMQKSSAFILRRRH
jgi:hypothetical protein